MDWNKTRGEVFSNKFKMSYKKDIENKCVGIGLDVRDNLISDGIDRNTAETLSTFATMSALKAAFWTENKLNMRFCDAIRKFVEMHKDDFGNLDSATAVVEIRRLIEEDDLRPEPAEDSNEEVF